MKADPADLMDRWFDLHRYLTNWDTRPVSIRLPKRLVDRRAIDRLNMAHESVSLRESNEKSIPDIVPSSDDPSNDWTPGRDWVEQDEEECWLTAIAPLRADLLAADLRPFYLIWLLAIQAEIGLHLGEDDDGWEYPGLEPDAIQSMPAIDPPGDAHQGFANFFGIDADLLAAASEVSIAAGERKPALIHDVIVAIAAGQQTVLLKRPQDGDPYVAAELRLEVGERLGSDADPAPGGRRTVRDRTSTSRKVQAERERAEESRRQATKAEQARQARLVVLARRGLAVWDEVQREIDRRNGPGHDLAASLFRDFQTIADEADTMDDFESRVRQLRERHGRKPRLIDRLGDL